MSQVTDPSARSVSSKPFRLARAPRAPLVRIPHPSWRLSRPAPDEVAPLSADEFWQRLGL
ncbi:hypothetical protein OLX02_07515 [Novosphingobium sp. KCTC 2891]|uniref:hypothetical protein n=1 Tax=Novosphingobium sp. KCTC 2891 TaxID=2989730 RepID=UPI002221E5F9|nr:hypothetical protein [Novosphingobium sp. KCTC 2891]MCW1382669.1 hypothetical protein [Novosphingobium sp. KCTC 2891]